MARRLTLRLVTRSGSRPETRIGHRATVDGLLDPELHVSAGFRRRYSLEERLFSLEGEAVVVNLEDTRTLASEINDRRDLLRDPDSAVRTGDINAMGLIDEIIHYVIDLYEEEHGADIWTRILDRLEGAIGAEARDETLVRFLQEFPPATVYRGEVDPRSYLDTEVDGKTGREVACEELLLLRLENDNPAYGLLREAFDDAELRSATEYDAFTTTMEAFFRELPPFGPDDEALVSMLRRPAIEHPDSLQDQLEFIRTRWSRLIGRFFFRLLRGSDLLREENRMRGPGPGGVPVPTYGGGLDERARYSPDRDWMPKVVLLAKNALVWLFQLSTEYGRPITRLDEIPDEELDTMAGRGFTGLWLIGIWQRSTASKRIKHLCGNPDAEASAYALTDYRIAEDIGGWDALHNLGERCAVRGIQLAGDMVPNHTGLDSRWVVDHPDWFVQLGDSPFPSYSFTGEDLCGSDDVTVQIEDHYFDRSDAAVVFRRVDRRSGDTRFIYHGNDGTHMPWNDTAQLNFLEPEAREAVIQTILHVAKSFRIIRFDAAMTIAKQHYQRLWFPAPGSGGDIPSRSEHGLSKEDFDQAMPTEFWREVVDRAAVEAPNTLLLAEAFWMMEGYFVRSLGMHRVYNSAFMNMLKNEDNQKYRQTIKNTIEFDREILKRFVNFMSNPDEETAIGQFGTGDKYFGVCTMMATMPGLPMFAHGQIEGFTEKYGMEYRRAYQDEAQDRELVERHNREIFPLLSKRYLFADVSEFCLYDVTKDDGSVTEDIFAYTNRDGAECALVVYNNSLSHNWGWIRESATFAEQLGNDERVYRRRDLVDVFGLIRDHRRFCLFRDIRSGHWYIRNSGEIADRGLFLSLRGYQCQVFGEFHEVLDDDFSHYARLSDALGGSGVPDIEEAMKEMLLKPLYESFATVVNSGLLFAVSEALLGRSPMRSDQIEAAVDGYRTFARVAVEYVDGSADPEAAARRFETLLTSCVALRYRSVEVSGTEAVAHHQATAFFSRGLETRPGRIEPLLAFILFMPLSSIVQDGRRRALGLIENWLLDRRLVRVVEILGYHEGSREDLRSLLRILFDHCDWLDDVRSRRDCHRAFLEIVRLPEIGQYLQVHRYDGTVWFNREQFGDLVWWLFTLAVLGNSGDPTAGKNARVTAMGGAYECVASWRELGEESGYRLETLADALSEQVSNADSEGQDEVY